jgi:NAD-specific glutamate dehydrogenase
MPLLGSACDIIRIAANAKGRSAASSRKSISNWANISISTGCARKRATSPPTTRGAIEALDGVVDSLYSAQAGLTVKILKDMGSEIGGKKKGTNDNIVPRWIETHGAQAQVIEPLFSDMRKATSVDLPMLMIAEQKLRGLFSG